jgi:hypothetical protein
MPFLKDNLVYANKQIKNNYTFEIKDIDETETLNIAG